MSGGIQLTGFKIYFNQLTKSVIKSIFWLSMTLFFGCLPLLLVFILSNFNIIEANHKVDEFMNDLFLPFLCCAIITEITMEAFLWKIKFSKYAYGFFIAAVAVLVFSVSMFFLIKFFTKGEIDVKLPNAWIFHLIVLTFTIAYSVFIKTAMFIEEDKIYKLCHR